MATGFSSFLSSSEESFSSFSLALPISSNTFNSLVLLPSETDLVFTKSGLNSSVSDNSSSSVFNAGKSNSKSSSRDLLFNLKIKNIYKI